MNLETQSNNNTKGGQLNIFQIAIASKSSNALKWFTHALVGNYIIF